jgi:hypothetical protein
LASAGVDDAAAVNVVPLNGYRATVDFWPADRPEPPAAERPEAHYRMVGPSYLSTFGVPLIQGRALDEHDTSISEPVIVINQTIAHRYWRGRSPVGEYLVVRDTGDNTVRRPRIVGVVGDVKHFGLDTESTADLYIAIRRFRPSIQWLANNMYWGVRTTGEPAAVRESVRREIKQSTRCAGVDANDGRHDGGGGSAETAQPVARSRLRMPRDTCGGRHLCSDSLLRVDSHREIGIRAILGARPLQNFTIVIADVSKPMLAGLAAGVLLSLAAAPALRTFLFAVNPVAR